MEIQVTSVTSLVFGTIFGLADKGPFAPGRSVPGAVGGKGAGRGGRGSTLAPLEGGDRYGRGRGGNGSR